MKYREIFRVENLPVFQNKMFVDRASALSCPKGDVALVQDMGTGLVFNAAFDASLLEYDSDYQNEQACSAIFQRHLGDVEKIIRRHFEGKALIEVGCGKGYFLEHLSSLGYQITGIDPAYEGDNPRVIKSRFEPGLGLSAEGILLRHVLEHMPDPLAFLSSIAETNAGKGLIYIEVPCFDWICRNRAWFDIFYEHVNYFRMEDFYSLFGTVCEIGHIFGGQYLYVVADLATLRRPVLGLKSPVMLPADFLDNVNRLSAIAQKRRSAIWGGASKGVIFSLYMQRAGVDIDLVIDINSAKQNKFMAGSGLKVLSPQDGMGQLHAGDNVFVMNSVYLPEIIKMSNDLYSYLQVDVDEF